MQNVLLAARQPLALMVLVAAVFTGLTVTIWMLPVGLLAYATAVFLAARDPSLAVSAQRSAAFARLTSPTFRAVIEEIDRSQREVEKSVARTEGALLRLLQPVVKQTGELVEQAHELARKGQVIEQYLTTINHQQLRSQIDQIDAQLARVTDSYTIQQLQETRKALVDRQSNAQALGTYIGRINAQLQNIDANLDNVLAETVRLRTADAVSYDSSSNQVADRLRDLNADMDAFQKVLDTALVQSGAGVV